MPKFEFLAGFDLIFEGFQVTVTVRSRGALPVACRVDAGAAILESDLSPATRAHAIAAGSRLRPAPKIKDVIEPHRLQARAHRRHDCRDLPAIRRWLPRRWILGTVSDERPQGGALLLRDPDARGAPCCIGWTFSHGRVLDAPRPEF